MMGDQPYRQGVDGLRRIRVELARGDLLFERVEGQEIVVLAETGVQVERIDDELRIGGPTGRPKRKMDVHIDIDLANLGAQINDAISTTLDTLLGGVRGGLGDGDVRIGIPAVLERPTIAANTHSGDLEARGLTADWTLRTGNGDVELRDCGGRLALQSARGDIRIEDFAGEAECVSGAGELTLRRIAGRVAARTGMGDVELAGCLAGGGIATGSGDVQADDLGGEWSMRSGSGDITVRIAEAGALAIQTGSGDARVQGGALSRLQIVTASGDVSCRSTLLGPAQLQTGNGDILLALADPPGARLELLTGNGEISSEFSLVRVGKQGPPARGSQRYVGNVGNSSIAVELRSNSGDITVTRLNPDAAAPDAGTNYAAATATTTSASGEMFQYQSQSSGGPLPPMAPMKPMAPMAPMKPMKPMALMSPLKPLSPEQATSPVPAEQASGRSGEPAARSDTTDGPTAGHGGDTADRDGDPAAAGASNEPDAVSAGQPDGRLRVLQSLQRGEISVAEASALLESLGRASA